MEAARRPGDAHGCMNRGIGEGATSACLAAKDQVSQGRCTWMGGIESEVMYKGCWLS